MKAKKLSIIIPLYNEERYISNLLDKVVAVNIPLEKEIIVVNDGSKDKSKEIVEQYIKTKAPDIKLINKPNGGKGSALKEGFKAASGDILIIQDSDLEYEPEDYPKLIQPIINGECKVVYGSRSLNPENKYSHLSFRLGGYLITLVTSLLYFTILTDEATCYKVFHKELKPILVNAEGNRFEWEPEITAKILRRGYRIKEIPIRYYPRKKAEGKKINYKDGLEAIATLIKWRFKRF